MLHILLLILKIIGIILAVILGILVLLICIVLFIPVRYEADGICKGTVDTLKAKVKVTWLFHLFRADIYFKERKLRWRIRIAWKKMTGGQKFSGEAKEDAKDGQKSKELQEVPQITQSEKLQTNEKVDEEKAIKKPEKTKEAEDTENSKKGRIQQKEFQEKSEKTSKVLEEKCSDTKRNTESHERRNDENDFDRSGKIKVIFEKIKNLYDKFKCTIKKICDKIKSLSEKKDKIIEFVQDESHIGAFLKVKSEVFRILRILRPKEFQAKAVIGFEDPQRTGQLLAVLSVIYPFMEDNLDVTPNFEHKVLKGKIHVKGHIRVCHFAALALRLLLCKHIRRTYKDIKKFEF